MRVQLCYQKEDTPKDRIICRDFTRVKDAMIIWDTQISKIAISGYLRKWDTWNYVKIKTLKEKKEG